METFAFLQIAVIYEDAVRVAQARSPLSCWLKLAHPTSALIVLAILLTQAALAQALEFGDRGPGVRELQQELRVGVDGVFGFETRQAVIEFQRRQGLFADGVGVAGPETLSALGLPPDLGPAGSAAISPGRVGTAIVAAREVNVYNSPSRGSSVRYVVRRRDRISFTGRSDDGRWLRLSGGGWVLTREVLGVRAADQGTIGGIGGDREVSLGEGRNARVAASSLNVRRSPNGTVIGLLGNGTPIRLTGEAQFAGGRSWVQLVDGGWVAQEFIEYR